MLKYKIDCPNCGKRIESVDSMSDVRSDLDDHMHLYHTDEPDPTFDPRFYGMVE